MRLTLILALATTSCMANPPSGNAVQEAPPRSPPPAPAPRPQPQRPADEPGHFYGGLGDTIQVGDISVKPLAIVEDSRCPEDVQCVWAGRVVLRAEISSVRGPQNISSIEPLTLPGGGTLVLASVWPPKNTRDSGPGQPYRFGFTRR